MPQASIDQFAIAHGLEEAGFNAVQAQAMVRAMNVISGSCERIASDVAELKQDVACLPELKQDVAQLKRDVARLLEPKQDMPQQAIAAKNQFPSKEFERDMRRLDIVFWTCLVLTALAIFAMLQFMLPGSP